MGPLATSPRGEALQGFCLWAHPPSYGKETLGTLTDNGLSMWMFLGCPARKNVCSELYKPFTVGRLDIWVGLHR